MGNGGVHAPDRDYVQEDSCHTCLLHHRGLCLFGQHCIHRDSCPSHSLCLENNEKHINIKVKYIIFITIWIGIMNPRCKIKTGATHSAVIYF